MTQERSSRKRLRPHFAPGPLGEGVGGKEGLKARENMEPKKIKGEKTKMEKEEKDHLT